MVMAAGPMTGQGPLSPITAREQDARPRANSVRWRKPETSRRPGAFHSPSLPGPLGDPDGVELGPATGEPMPPLLFRNPRDREGGLLILSCIHWRCHIPGRYAHWSR
jgi:hypothetical protein